MKHQHICRKKRDKTLCGLFAASSYAACVGVRTQDCLPIINSIAKLAADSAPAVAFFSIGSGRKEMKSTFKNMALVVACVTVSIGCASTRMGTDFNSANVNKLKVGKTTEQEVIQLIGQPVQRTRSADGTVTLEYMYSPGQTIHAFTPITDPDYVQKAGKGTKQLVVKLGSNGKVLDFKESGSQ